MKAVIAVHWIQDFVFPSRQNARFLLVVLIPSEISVHV